MGDLFLNRRDGKIIVCSYCIYPYCLLDSLLALDISVQMPNL